eukprot:23975-Eustigmatos_ZCMA.PRE.1
MPHLKAQSEGRSRADEVSRWSTIDGDLYTPLHAAIIARSAPTLRVLLDSGTSCRGTACRHDRDCNGPQRCAVQLK